RKELSNYKARGSRCFNTGCLSLTAVTGPAGDWRQPSAPVLDELEQGSQSGQPATGIAAAAAAVARRTIGRDGYGEPTEGASATTPPLTMVISQGVIGQDPPISVVVHENQLMDDAIAEMWTRRIAFGADVEWR